MTSPSNTSDDNGFSASDSELHRLATVAIHELSQAWRRLLLYPPGHPERSTVAETATRALNEALGDAPFLAIGITRDGFVIEEQMHGDLGSKELANLLYRRNVAVMRISPGLTPESFEEFLQSLRSDTDSITFDLDDETPSLHWPGVRLENADFSSLLSREDRPSRQAHHHRLTLWERVLQLQMRDQSYLGDVGSGSAPALQQTLQRTLSSLPRDMLSNDFRGDYPEQVQQIVELLQLAIVEHVRDAVSARRLVELEQVNELLSDLPDVIATAALEKSIAILAENDEEKIHLGALLAATNVAQAMAAVRRLRDQRFRFCTSALEHVRDLAERAALETTRDVHQSVALDSVLNDGRDAAVIPSPDDLLFTLGTCRNPGADWPTALESLRGSLQAGSIELALLNALCEVLAQPHVHERTAQALVPRMEQLFGDLVEHGHPMAAVGVVHSLRDLESQHGARLHAAIEDLFSQLNGPGLAKRITRMLNTADERQKSQLETLVQTLGDRQIDSLVHHLAEEEDRAVRRSLFDFLKNLRSQVMPSVRRGLNDPRWFVVRNMVSLLDEIDDRGSIPLLRKAALHGDLRVRTAAIRALVRMDKALPDALITQLFQTPDAAFVERTMALLGRSRVRTAVGPLLQFLKQRDSMARNRAVRVRAIEALGYIGHPNALHAITPLLSGLRLQSIEERRAAYRSLGGYPLNMVAEYLNKGLRARDTEIRETCDRILRGEVSRGPQSGGLPTGTPGGQYDD